MENEQTGYEDDAYTSRQGIDVSHHQGEINWEKVKASGIDFAILRIGYRGYGQEGTLNLDQEFNRNIENAQAAGIDVGVYFFAQAINEDEAREEADFVLQNLEGYELQLPVVYDPESILDADARTDEVSGEQFTKNTIAFCEKIKEAGYSPMIYSNMLWEAFEFDMEQLTMYPFWYADYEALPQTPYAYEMWQYSESGQVDGIDGVVDLDVQFLPK
jgi:GH25 family lysozyme M1 (1,4-beta-N-acetylmuramidase)